MIATPDSRTCATNSSSRELDAEAGDRLELVERAAGVAEAAAAHHRERHAARGDERRRAERGLVADAAGRVLVDDLAPERRRSSGSPLAQHRLGERERLGARQAAEEDRHEPRGHLVVGHVAAHVADDSPPRPRRAMRPPSRFRSIRWAEQVLGLVLTEGLGRRGVRRASRDEDRHPHARAHRPDVVGDPIGFGGPGVGHRPDVASNGSATARSTRPRTWRS